LLVEAKYLQITSYFWHTHRTPNFVRYFATNYRALLQKTTNEDKVSYGSLPPCNDLIFRLHRTSSMPTGRLTLCDNTLQHTATHCNTLQHNATHCNTLRTPNFVRYLTKLATNLIERNPPPPGGFPIYYVPSSRTVSNRTPLEEPGTNPS